MKLEIVDSVGGFDALRDEWNEAAAANVDSNVFLTWEWLRTWWAHFGERSTGNRLHVVLVRDGADIVAAGPWFKATRAVGPLRATRLQQIGYDAGDYGGILLTRDDPAPLDDVVAHLAGELHRGVSTVSLSRLASDSAFLRLLRATLAGVGGLSFDEFVADGSVCPFATIGEDYDLTKRLRKNRVPQRLRRLAEQYEAAFEYHSGSNLEEGLKHLVELHRRRWVDRPGEFTGLLADSEGEDFLLDAVRAFDAAGWLRLLTLTADGQPVATRLDFEYGGRLYMLKNAIDPEFGEFGPGHLTHGHAIERAIDDGVEEVDFLRGDHPYKRRWATGERHLVAVNLGRPRIAGQIARARSRVVRRLARWIETRDWRTLNVSR